ncbi:hypothetical protein Tco_1384400 [Tanacetum coccineum]
MGCSIGSTTRALEPRIDVAMAHSYGPGYKSLISVSGFLTRGWTLRHLSPQSSMRFVKKKSLPPPLIKLTDTQKSDIRMRKFVEFKFLCITSIRTANRTVPMRSASIADFPVGKVGVYTRFFEFANQRVPLSLFMCNVLNHYRLHISQLHCIGAAKTNPISRFNCCFIAFHSSTVHLFRAFYHTSWSNGWVSFSKRAGRLQCYTEKLDALRRWREMFFWVDDALVPWDFAFYTQGSLPRDERPPPGSYSMEDAELINENRIPINAYSEAFLCHMGISRNYFQSPEEVPTFIGDDGGGEGALSFFSLVLVVAHNETRVEAIRRLSGTDVVSTTTPCAGVPVNCEPPGKRTSVGSSEDADVAEVDSGLKRKRATNDDGAGPSKRVRPVSLVSRRLAIPLRRCVAMVVQSPPQTNPLTADDISRRGRETGPKAFEGMPVDQLMEELDMVTAQQAALVAQLRARLSRERGQSVQKDEEILLLKTQLADAQAEARFLFSEREQERADSADYKASCHWAVKYLEGGKNNHFAGLDDFRQRVEGLLEKQEEKLRKLSIEYDEELYPHMLSAIAERRWLISHGLRLAAMSTLESQEVKQSFGDVVKCALARGKAEAVEELHEKKLLTVPAAQVPGYNHNAYEELVAAMEAMKLLELPHIAQLERDQDYPIGVIMAGLTLARHATEGAEAQPDYFLKPDRPTAIIRLAKKKGVKGKAILCGVGAAHVPRSDGVPVSVATVSPKDSELLGKLEEAGDAAYQVGSSERSRYSHAPSCAAGIPFVDLRT